MGALVEATARVLATDGAGAVTTTRVAEVAGVSVGSLYQYFPTRESLIAAVIQDRAQRDEERLRALLPSLAGAPVEAVLRALAEFIVGAFREAPRLYAELVQAMGPLERQQLVDAMIERCAALTLEHTAAHRERLAHRDPELAVRLAAIAVVAIVRDTARRRPELLASSVLVDELHAMMLGYLVRR